MRFAIVLVGASNAACQSPNQASGGGSLPRTARGMPDLADKLHQATHATLTNRPRAGTAR